MKKRNLIITILLLVSSIIFIILLKTVDIKCNTVNNSCIGFATVNQFIFDKIGVVYYYRLVRNNSHSNVNSICTCWI